MAPYASAKPDLEGAINRLFNSELYELVIEEGLKLLQVFPEIHEVKNKVALALDKIDRKDEALILLADLLKDFPDNPLLIQKMAIILKEQKKYQEASQFFIHLMQIDQSRSAMALSHLGNISSALGSYFNAADFYKKSLDLDPDNIETLKNLVGMLSVSNNLEDAIKYSESALKKHPNEGDLRGFLISQLQISCDWDKLLAHNNYFSHIGITGSPVAPFSLMPIDPNAETQLLRMRNYTELKMPNVSRAQLNHEPLEGRKIKIGYFSSDFCTHATMDLMSGLLRQHNHGEFEIHLFSYGVSIGDEGEKIARKYSDYFHIIRPLTDSQSADFARGIGIDVAIDLKGHTKGSRPGIFGWSPAPVSVNFLGYPGTLGSDRYDYMIVDRITVPEGSEGFYDEKLIFMPGSYQPNDNQRQKPLIATSRADEALPEDAFVFCCLNQAYKILPEEFGLWMQILKRVDHSVLWLFSRSEIAIRNLQKTAVGLGVDPNRLVFARPVDEAMHLARYRHADVFLDTFICNAHTTAAEALWMGVPVITKPGQAFASRVAASLLSALGLNELIVETNEDYVELACLFAEDKSFFNSLKDKVVSNQRSTALFNTEDYTCALEHGLRQSVLRSIQGQSTEHIFC